MIKSETAITATKVQLQNEQASLTVDLSGGAFTDFHLHHNPVNPLSFKFTREQMPENNRAGAPYQGHFLCAGRWGEPSAGEKKAGVPNHGELANILWEKIGSSDRHLTMSVTGLLEGLRVNRSVALDRKCAAFAVEETVINLNTIGRLYNVVQHPTLSFPFLDQHTLIDSNASSGFNQVFYKEPEKHAMDWPKGYCEDGSTIDLQNPAEAYTSVFSFVVDKESQYGWVTALSHTHNLLFGYVWKREDYPWIHLWQHWEDNQIKYRGIEFGTAGIHQPFPEILASHSQIFGEKTFRYIDAGENISRRFISFLTPVSTDFPGVEDIAFQDGMIQISSKTHEYKVQLETGFDGFL